MITTQYRLCVSYARLTIGELVCASAWSRDVSITSCSLPKSCLHLSEPRYHCTVQMKQSQQDWLLGRLYTHSWFPNQGSLHNWLPYRVCLHNWFPDHRESLHNWFPCRESVHNSFPYWIGWHEECQPNDCIRSAALSNNLDGYPFLRF